MQKAHFDWEEAHHHQAEEAKQQEATEARKQVRKLELQVMELQMEKQVEAESLEPIQLEKQHQLEALQQQATSMKTQLQAANDKINKMSDLADQMIELQQQQQQQLNAYSEAAEQAQQRLTKKEAAIFKLEAKVRDLQQPTEQKLQEGSGHQQQASMQRKIDLLELELHRLRPTHVLENPLWDPSGDSESVPPGGTKPASPPAQDNSRNQLEQAASPAESAVEASVPSVKRTAPKLKKQGSSAYKASKLKKQAAAKTAAAAPELLEAAKAAAAVPATADHSEAKAAASVPAASVLLEQAAVEKQAEVKVATQEQPPPSHTESAVSKAVAEAELDSVVRPNELKELTIIIEAKSNELFDLQQLMLQSPKSRRKALKKEISVLDLEIAGLHSQIPKTGSKARDQWTGQQPIDRNKTLTLLPVI